MPVVIIADLIAEGLHEGFFDLSKPTTPETCGQDMEVPEITLKSGGFFPCGVEFESLPSHAARMFTPGADMSGCIKTNSYVKFGHEFFKICRRQAASYLDYV